jgi:hypothetical protein
MRLDKRKLILNIVVIFMVSALLVVSCAPMPVNATDAMDNPRTTDDEQIVSSPEMARDATIAYLRDDYSSVPSSNVSWAGEDISSKKAVSTSNYLYTFRDWTVSVVSPEVNQQNKIYTVIVRNDENDFKWAGLVDYYGKIIKMGRLQTALMVSTSTPAPTSTPLPTLTPIPPTETPETASCLDATFLEDATVPDGTTFTPGTGFLKEWRLRNAGSCTWTTDYDLVYVGGNRLGAQSVVPLSETVKPGESAELGVYMVAPRTPGEYRGFWMLRNANGRRFGIGDQADDSFWVEIQVAGNVSDYNYDFALSYCDAIWRSATGRIPCGNAATPSNGSVQFLIAPAFENRHENEPTIWLHPNESQDGWIEGSYPAIDIQSGDSFKAWVGCMEGYDLCDVTFYLAYTDENNHTYTVDRWHEVYDNQVTTIDIDLSNLAGQSVQFILGMEASSEDVRSAQGFWFVPRIERE